LFQIAWHQASKYVPFEIESSIDFNQNNSQVCKKDFLSLSRKTNGNDLQPAHIFIKGKCFGKHQKKR